MELPDSPASPPLVEAVPAPAADPSPEAPLSASVQPDNAGTVDQPALPDTAALPLPPPRQVVRAPQPPDPAALENARRGIWVMNENHDGWVLLGADRKPVMRKDRSRVSFRFRDAARLAQELAVSDESDAPATDSVPLAPLDSGYNRNWDPQAQKSFLADITKACRLLAYQYVQFTEPQEAVRRAVSDILQNPTYVKGPQMNAWVPGKFDVEAVKLVAATLHKRAIGPEVAEGDRRKATVSPMTGSGAAIVGGLRRGAGVPRDKTGMIGDAIDGQKPNTGAAINESKGDDGFLIFEIDSNEDSGDGVTRIANVLPGFQGDGQFIVHPEGKALGSVGTYNPRAEHGPPHFHLRLNDGCEIRYLADTFEVFKDDRDKDTRRHDRLIRKLSPFERELISKATNELFTNGQLSPETKAKRDTYGKKAINKAIRRLPREP